MSPPAKEIYDSLTFNSDRLYNEPAPDVWISFLIAGVLSSFTWLYYVIRVRRIYRALASKRFSVSFYTRILVAAYIDNDDAFFTCVKFAAQSFVFLGGIQLNYEGAYIAMLAVFALESTLDSLRVILAFFEADSLATYTHVSDKLRRETAVNTTQLTPGNVYEDLTRERAIVLMVFITQCVLIAFIVYDVYDTPTHSCHDATPGCPVVGTLGSWCFYVLGIFMATVFLVGPKTSFGQSEQNPAYWLKLLLMSKQTGARVTWYDPMTDQIVHRKLSRRDWRTWTRFCMSFCINGVGFHILVHALPIQVAAQSSLTGVVFRAVGMMYLVDLDDTTGLTMTLVEEGDEPDKVEPLETIQEEEEGGRRATNDDGVIEVNRPQPSERSEGTHTGIISVGKLLSTRSGFADLEADENGFTQAEMQILTQKIIDDAKTKLDLLAQGQSPGSGLTMTGALAMASGITTGATIHKQYQTDNPTTREDGDGISSRTIGSMHNIMAQQQQGTALPSGHGRIGGDSM